LIFVPVFKKQRFGYPKWSAARKADWHFKLKEKPRFNWKQFSDYWLPGFIILELVVFSVIFALIFRYPKFEEVAAPSAIQSEKSGQEICLQNATSTLFAVMIDNMIDSRPAYGLSRADLVFEAPTEAGITRFLAVFCGDEPADFKIGPVRSLRPYFLDFAEDIEAPIAHVGGSPEAMARIKNSSVPDLDQYYNGGYFERSSDRLAPHNVFTNIKKLTSFLNNRFPNFRAEREVWQYKDESSAQNTEAKEINVDYIRPEHLVRWVYDSASNSYFRYQNGAEHTDADGSKISAKNVVIQITDIEVIDEIGRRKIRTTGEGKAMIFMDGKIIRGSWEAEKRSLVRFYDAAGREIQFNKGPIWIEVVSEAHKINIAN
jgi:hypothetical protein